MPGLWKNNPETPEGKYLVKRRDGSIPEWPHFVIGAADPNAPDALRAYALSASANGCDPEFVEDVWLLADEFERWRGKHGSGDPGAPRHREDDPETVAEMKQGKSA